MATAQYPIFVLTPSGSIFRFSQDAIRQQKQAENKKVVIKNIPELFGGDWEIHRQLEPLWKNTGHIVAVYHPNRYHHQVLDLNRNERSNGTVQSTMAICQLRCQSPPPLNLAPKYNQQKTINFHPFFFKENNLSNCVNYLKDPSKAHYSCWNANKKMASDR